MSKDGNSYAPISRKSKRVCEKGDFPISIVGLDHGHINGMTENMLEAGADISLVWDKDPQKVDQFKKLFPDVRIARSEQEIYDDRKTKMILSSIIANERWQVGQQALLHGKHYMSDKTGFTQMDQLDVAKETVAKTELKWSICFFERLQVESAILAGQLIDAGEIGRVVQVMNIAPHRLSVDSRPDWFFNKKQYGGILCDIGSHQIDQMLFYTKSNTGKVVHSQVGNFNNPSYPELEDFGECSLLLDSGASGYCRLDWFTPENLNTWGDGRLFILGTKGYIEVRKYTDVTVSDEENTVILVNNTSTKRIQATGKTGFPYFGQLILDCLEGTNLALPQSHIFETSRLAIEAEDKASRLAGFK